MKRKKNDPKCWEELTTDKERAGFVFRTTPIMFRKEDLKEIKLYEKSIQEEKED